MAQFALSKRIAAPPAAVFAVVTDLDHISAVIPDIKKIEVLTPGPTGVGTRFRETRVMFGREAAETFQVIEFDPGVRYTTYADSCGVLYLCEHRFSADGGDTVLELTITTMAKTLFAKLMTPLGWVMQGVMRKCVMRDLDAIARAAEPPLLARAA